MLKTFQYCAFIFSLYLSSPSLLAFEFKQIRNLDTFQKICADMGSDAKTLKPEGNDEENLIKRWHKIYEKICTNPGRIITTREVFVAFNFDKQIESVLVGNGQDGASSYYIDNLLVVPKNLEIKENNQRSKGAAKFIIMALKDYVSKHYPSASNLELIAEKGSEGFYEHIGFTRKLLDTYILAIR